MGGAGFFRVFFSDFFFFERTRPAASMRPPLASFTSLLVYDNEEQTSERSDDVSPYLMVSCGQVPVRKFPERLPTRCLYLIKLVFPPWCVCWCVLVCASTLVHRTPPKEHGFRPRGRLWSPLFSGTTDLCPRPKQC